MEGEAFEENPVIECGDVVLRRFKMDDIDDLVTNINDRGISRYTLNIPHPYQPEDGISFLENNEGWFEKGRSLNLAITDKKFDRVIGSIGIMKIEWANGTAQIGYWLGKEHWGKGITPQAVKGLVKYGFDKLKLHRMESVIFSPNTRSRRVMQKCGFIHEGTMRKRYILDDGYVDGEIYSILKEDFDDLTC